MLIEDNEGCVFMVKNQSTSATTKHIDISAHFMRGHYMKASFDIIKTDTLEQDADPLTKNLPENDCTKSTQKITGTELCLSTRVGTTFFNRLATASEGMDAFSVQREDVKRNYLKELREVLGDKRTPGKQVCAKMHGLV